MKPFKAACVFVLGLLLTSVASVAIAQTATVNSLNNITNRAGTYYGSATYTLAATPTDIAILRGSATKTVYVKSVDITCAGGSVAVAPTVAIVKRSNANVTHVSQVAVTAVAADSSDSAATASLITYTSAGANSSQVGSGVQVVSTHLNMVSSVAAAPMGNNQLSKSWGTGMDKYIVLRGVAQGLAINLGGATTTGASCAVSYSWIER